MDLMKIAQEVSIGVFKEHLLSELMDKIRADYPNQKAHISNFWQSEDEIDVNLHMEFEFELPRKTPDETDDQEEETIYDIKDKLDGYFSDFTYHNSDGHFVDVRYDVKEKVDAWKVKAIYEEGVD